MPSEESHHVVHPHPSIAKNAHVNSYQQYQQMYQKSLENPEEFWGEIAKQFHFETPVKDKFFRYNFDLTKGPIFNKWLDGATTNISYNLLDRNVRNGHGDKVAYYWEGNHPDDYSRLTYKKLLEEVCRFANVLKSRGVQKGDRVAVYMPMILEAVITLLACTRIGAIHSLVFAGFSSDSFAERILDCEARVVVTADGVWRGEKLLQLKSICDHAMDKCSKEGHNVETCIVVSHLERVSSPKGGSQTRQTNKTPMTPGRDLWWQEVVPQASTSCYPEWMKAEDPLFMLYTSGSTGKPKGVVHTTAGYLLYSATTFKYVFDYKPNDVYWCTADIGWITGHSYVVYGPLANAATSVLFEGTPFFPGNDRFWSVIDKYKVTQFYTAPTAIRALMKFDDHLVTKHDLSAQPQMEAELIIQEQSLLPCHVCGRTFLSNPLKKHVKVCEKNAIKRRKPFDSLKQRVAGTDLADFHQATYLKKREEPVVEKKPKPSKWKEKHLELVTAIRAAKGGSSTVIPLSPSTPKPIRSTTSLISSTSQNERCPSCERHFGPKAFDRHVEWCREKKARIQHQPANVQEAKERLEARIKYRVPPLNKSKRSLVREKYSSPHSPEPMRRSNTSNFSSPALSRGPSIRKPKSLVDVERKTPDVKSEKNKRTSPDRSVMSFTSSSSPRSTTPQTESIKSNSSSYDPFEVAQRQFMELLECDDFKPFTPSNRTLKTPTSPQSVKKPTKRESVIDPPITFKDSMESVTDNDDFELIENIINEHFGESPKESETGFYLHNIKADKDPLALDNILDRKYSDDIDPRLINENDNLSIPEHLKVEDYSPTSTSTIGTDNTLQNDVDHYSVLYDSKIEPKATKKPLMKRSLSLVNRSKRETTLTSTKSFNTTVKKPSNQTVKPKVTNKNNVTQKNNNLSSTKKPSTKAPEKKKALPLLKRSMTLIDPAPKPSFKNKQEVNNFFNGNETSKMSTSLQATITTDNLKAEDLFSVDDEMYEEYKKYEELYLKEKELNANSNKKNKNKPADLTNYGLLANSEEEDRSNSSNIKLSNDSAYGSLRKSSKHRIRAPRLSPLEPKSVENTSSSGSENGLNSPAIQSDGFSKVSKFCHECGTKFPVTTAKFCVECGVKRLVL